MRNWGIAEVSALVMCSLSWADTAGMLVLHSGLPGGRVAMDLCVTLSGSTSRVQSVVRDTVDTTAPGGFYQSPDNPFWQPSIQKAATSVDSFDTNGTNPNGSGLTSPGAVDLGALLAAWGECP